MKKVTQIQYWVKNQPDKNSIFILWNVYLHVQFTSLHQGMAHASASIQAAQDAAPTGQDKVNAMMESRDSAENRPCSGRAS